MDLNVMSLAAYFLDPASMGLDASITLGVVQITNWIKEHAQLVKQWPAWCVKLVSFVPIINSDPSKLYILLPFIVAFVLALANSGGTHIELCLKQAAGYGAAAIASHNLIGESVVAPAPSNT